MSRINLFRVFILVVLTFSPVVKAKPTEEMIGTWNQFLEALSKGDTAFLIKKSASEIDCWLWPCTYRPGKEYLYSADKFYEIHSDYLYSDRFLNILRTGKKYFVAKEGGNDFEVIITTIESNAKHDGLQTAFYFKKIDNEYLFSHISTIP